MSNFKKRYLKLNPEQKEAVDTLDGPVMIIAGPGTGKTTTLTMRIANILKKTDTSPQSVLALTFTESGVNAMREKLLEIIGPTAYYVNIYTFHSFCTDVIKEYPEEFLIDSDTTPLSELERIEVFKNIIKNLDLDKLKPVNSPYFYTNAAISSIQNLKRENILPSKFEKIIEDNQEVYDSIEEKVNPKTGKLYTKYRKRKKNLAKQSELLKIYRAYQKKLQEMKRYDFEDMINFVVEKLKKDENLKLNLQEKYLYILVDEYQDTNTAQNEIVRLLTDTWENPNIFVVGDDEQSIYRFQGASLENIIYFKKLFSNAKVITLTSNYRSSQHILDASRSLINKNTLSLEDVDKDLKAKLDIENKPIKVAQFSNSYAENLFITSEVKKLIDKGADPDEIAVLAKTNADLYDLKDYFSNEDIRYEISSGRNVLENGDINRLLLLFRVIRDLNNKPSDDIDLFTLLNFEFLDFDKLDILKLSRFASEKKKNILDVIIDEDLFAETTVSQPEKFIGFINKLNNWQNLDANTSFTKFFEKVLHESKFLDWILKDKYNVSRINSINTLFEEAKKLNQSDHQLDLKQFLDTIELLKENGITLQEYKLEPDIEAVKLLTAHKAKGLEFEYVFVYRCIDKKWGNFVHRNLIKLPENILENVDISKKEKNEDERRLFYVALTRAKKEVIITYADEYTSGSYKSEKVPSMFISEIDKNLKQKVDTKKFQKSIGDKIKNQLKLTESEEAQINQEDFLNSMLSSFKLNVTALNTYLKCPYKFKLNNVLRTPRAKSVYLSFGSSVHKALERFFKRYKKTDKIPPLTYLLDSFDEALDKEILEDEEFERLKKKGHKVLTEYFTRHDGKFNKPLYIEYPFGFRKVYLDNIPLSGKIDKVEWLDKPSREVKVIDYKTGNPKTKGQIKGTTKYSDGDLMRQLVFYKLLSSLDRNFTPVVKQGEFQFIESKGNKKARTETFTYTPDQITNMKKLIHETMQKIKDHKFDRTDEYRHCEYCDYKDHCWIDGIPEK